MTNNPAPRVVRHRGMTLLELTITIVILLVLLSIIFIGSRGWKQGGDRADCVLTLRNVQVAARCYQNLYGYNCGDRPLEENGSRDIARQLYDKGYIEKKLYDQANGMEPCPGGGTYGRPAPDIFPQAGDLYMTCSLAVAASHEPAVHLDW